MSPALVNTDSFGVDGTTHNLVLGFTPTQGNKLLLAISHYNASRVTRINTGGVVWTLIQLLDTGSFGSLGTTTEHWIGDVVGSSPGTNLDIFTSGGFADRAIAVHEVSGLREIWPADKLSQADAQASPITTGSTGLPLNPDSYFFGAAGGADSSVTTIPGAPSNGFTKREEEIGPNANTNIGHRITTFDKIVSAQEAASSSLAYAGFTRWAALMSTLRADTEPTKPIQLVQKKSASIASNPDTVTLDAAPQNGNTLLLFVAVDLNQQVTSIVQSGVQWSLDAAVTHGNNNIRVEIWRATPASAASADIEITFSGSNNANVFVHEYSGVLEAVLSQDPLDQTATNTGAGAAVSTGQTAAVDSKDELVVGVMAQLNAASDFQEAFGFFREDQGSNSFITQAVFRQDESFPTLQYEIQADSDVSGDWAAAIATYRNAVSATAGGPPMDYYSADRNQSGTSDPISSTSFASFAYDLGRYKPHASGPTGFNEMWATNRVLELGSADSVDVEVRRSSGNNGVLREVNLVIIDLDSINFFAGRDWFHEEDATAIVDMDATFANNVGATMRFRPDGVSNYLVIGHARMSAAGPTPVAAENAARLRDVTNAVTLAQGGWHKSLVTDVVTHGINVMAVLEAPSEADLDLAIEMIGGGASGWDHDDSSITVIRLDQFFSVGFDQAAPNTTPGFTMPPSAGHIDAQALFPYEPDLDREIVTLVYAEADNVADDFQGMASQAQFPGVVGERSLWDTENTTLGNVVSNNETVVGNYDTNNTETRIPTFGVSRRTGIPPIPDTAQLFNGTHSGGASVLKRVVLVCFGKQTAPIPSQDPSPDPLPAPTATTVLTEKPDGTHVEEAFENQLEQFKPGSV
jgi:hypothetical protein